MCRLPLPGSPNLQTIIVRVVCTKLLLNFPSGVIRLLKSCIGRTELYEMTQLPCSKVYTENCLERGSVQNKDYIMSQLNVLQYIVLSFSSLSGLWMFFLKTRNSGTCQLFVFKTVGWRKEFETGQKFLRRETIFKVLHRQLVKFPFCQNVYERVFDPIRPIHLKCWNHPLLLPL